ncbi:MAG: helix-turn-helix domain-containing protein [Chloroflexota bacterium]|jgi:cytoskeletal protein RodZ
MPTMGEVLTDARHRRGVTIEDAEAYTKIRKKYLIALEEDDYSELPEPIYARGFLQIYAEYLGIDPDFAVKLFNPPNPIPSPTMMIKPAASGLPSRPGLPLRGFVFFSLACLGIAALFYLYAQYAAYVSNSLGTIGSLDLTPRPAALTTPTVVALAPAPTATATPLPTPSPTPSQGVVVIARITDRCWMRVIADGQTSSPLFEGELDAGDTRTWKARDRIDMRVGNAGAIEVTVNGMFQGKLGASGEVKNVSWGRQ